MPIALATCKGQPETVFADKACAHPAKLATMQQQDMHKDGQMARADKDKAGKKGSKAAKGSPSKRKDLTVVVSAQARPAPATHTPVALRPKVIIAGAGIGGLVLALMLHRRGISCVICEQASAVREVGVGINTLPHAIKELADLGLLPALDAAGIRTQELFYMNRIGQIVWREPRGVAAGFEVPQFSIHRGRLQKLIFDAVVERLGAGAIRTGRKLAGFIQDEGGVTAHFVDSIDGSGSETLRAEVLVGADGIHSVVRGHYAPQQGLPRWNGVMMWRGAADHPAFLGGRSMIIAGGMGAKLVLYPIADGAQPGTRLTNWVVTARVSDTPHPPGKESWSRRGRLDEVLPYARRYAIPGFDVTGLIHATDAFYEYPMCDRDPLPRWSHGRVTLLGDAAHPMYPVGSNGASQAILDARSLADHLARAEHPYQALQAYEADRLPKTAEIVALNRKGGPERVIDEVEKLAPAGFTDIERVLSHDERKAIVRGYAGTAGFALTQVNRKAG
jgi:2-polyprenyl-6-methoxyphenol hydroxylase-like FAD-dependent oxidoreductase